MEEQKIKELVHTVLMEIKNNNDLTEKMAHSCECAYPTKKLKKMSFTFHYVGVFLKNFLEGTVENINKTDDDVIKLLTHSLKCNEGCLALIKYLSYWGDYLLLKKITEYFENKI